MSNKIPRDAFPEHMVRAMAEFSCHCQRSGPMVERNTHGPSCLVGQSQEYLGKKVSWEWCGEPRESPLESAKEMHERYCREVEQFDECNPTDAQEFDAQVSGVVAEIMDQIKKATEATCEAVDDSGVRCRQIAMCAAESEGVRVPLCAYHGNAAMAARLAVGPLAADPTVK